MSSEFKINNNLFDSLNEIINIPFMLMDNMGNVLSCNKEAGLLFHFDHDNNNIYDELDDPSCEIVNGMIENLFSDAVPVVQLTNLRLKSGGEIKGTAFPNFSAVSKHLFIVSIVTKGLTPS